VIATRMVLQSAYSREVEAAADAYGVALISKVGGDSRALGAILTRIGGATEPAMTILLDHPETKARVAAINAMATTSSSMPLLDAAEWAAVKHICSGS
jgi:predicted Zn-dependent protease